MEIQVEVSKDLPLLDETRKLQKFIKTIDAHLTASLGFSPKITLVEPKTIQRSSGGKMRRVTDKREI